VPTNQPTVSVIIPARDAAGSLRVALKAVAKQTYPEILEVVVAAADDESAAEARANGATVVENPAGTTPRGLNLALAASKGEIVVRCDAQSIIPPDYVARVVATLERTSAANVGGMQVPVGDTPWENAIAAAMSSPWGAGDARYRVGGEEGPVETVYLGAFRRSAIERIGGFDESFLRTQDYELNHRLIETGAIVWFDPTLKVGYRPRGSLGALARQYYEYGRAKRQFSRKHPGSLHPRQLAPPLLLVALVASVITSVWTPVALVVPALYVVSLVLASIPTQGDAMRTAMALGTMHLAWGSGFIGPLSDDGWAPEPGESPDR